MDQPASATTEAPACLERVVAGFAELPTLAPVAIEVIRLADDEQASLADLAHAIGVDLGLTTRLLRLANSAMYGQAKEVSSLERATALLGLRTVKLLSLGFTLVANLSGGPIDTSIIWRRSLATSVLARRLALEVDKRLTDDAFVAGLLSNIGKLALASEPAYVEAITSNGPWLTHAEERAILGFTSDEVTSRILSDWGLPEVLAETVRTREQATPGSPTARLAATLNVADAAARLILVDTAEAKAEALEALTISSDQHLDLGLDQMEAIITDLRPDLNEFATMFELDAIAKTPISEIMSSAQEHLARLALDLATTLSHEEQRIEELVEDNERLAAEASTDPLTGLANRRVFDDFLANQVSGRARTRRGSSLALIMFDLDHFKIINDTHGHAIGDDVLRTVGRRIEEGTRRSELSARIGGEEFAVILPDVHPEELAKAAERFRALISDESVPTGVGPVSVTTSVGAAHTLRFDKQTPKGLFNTADAALYSSKESGRDRVTVRPFE